MAKKRPGKPPVQKTPAPVFPRWAPVVIALAALIVYAGSFSGPFVYDDRGTVTDNRTIEDIWSLGVLAAPHETPVAGRPVANLSFALNFTLGGRDVTGYHVVNLLIHVLCGWTLFGIVRRSQPSVHAAFAVALLWTVHPLASEAVNYVTQRTESLMALFYLSTLYCAIRAAAGGGRGRWEAAAVIACALGMASKESMVTAPLAVLLYDRVFLFDSLQDALRSRRRLYLGLASTWLLLAALVWSAPRNLSAGFSAHEADVWTYLLNQAVMISRYLWLVIWPRDLVLYYGWPVSLTLGQVLPQAALIVSLLALTVFALRRYPRAGFLAALLFLTLAPTSSILPIATEVGAERRIYLGLMAIVALAVFAYRQIVSSSHLRTGALAVLTVLLGIGTVGRTAEYQSSLRLAETTFERWPTAAAHSMLGTELAAAGRLGDAESHLRAAAPVHPPARYYLGTVLAAQGRPAEAIDNFHAFIASQPAELDQVHVARARLASALTSEGRLGEAEAQYRAMLARRPDDVEAMRLLAQTLFRQRKPDEAVTLFRRVIAARPGDAAALNGLGTSLASTGQLDEAIAIFRRVLDTNPQNIPAQQNLARALALRGR